MNKLITLLTLFLLSGFMLHGQDTITIGNGTTSWYDPMPGWYGWNHNVMMYTSDEIDTSGMITGIAFNFSSAGSFSGTKAMTIYMMTTPSSVLNSSVIPNFNAIIAQADLVHTLTPAQLSFTTGWVTFTLDNPFFYDGNENLLIIVEGRGCTNSGSCSSQIYTHSTSTNRHWYSNKDSSPLTGSEAGTFTASYRANIRLTIEDANLTCPRVSGLAVSDILSNSATVTWTPGGEETQWLVSYRSSEAIWSDWVLVENAPTYSFDADPLSSNTEYIVRVAALCGVEDTSLYRQTTFRTTCGNIAPLPWLEDFNSYGTGSGVFPLCWERYNNGTVTTSNPYINSNQTHSAPGSMYFSNSNSLTLVTPPFEDDINTLMITFWLMREGSSSGTFSVGYLTTPGNPTTFVALETISNHPYDPDVWLKYEFSFADAPAGIKQFAFRQNQSSSSWYYWLDDILVEPIPSCPRIRSINSDPVGTSATASWVQAGSETQWLVSYKLSSASEWSNEELISQPSYLMEPLTELTSYDIRVRAYCEDGDTSTYTITTFTTGLLPVAIPFEENFEAPTSWELINGTQTNKWVIDADATANNNGDTLCLYITNNANATPPPYTYSHTTSHVYAVKYINFETAGDYFIGYDWKAQGESASYDYMRVWLAPFSATFTAGTGMGSSPGTPSGYVDLCGASLNRNSTWQNKEIEFTVSETGVYKLVFYWYNDGGGGTPPPAAIDNISLYKITCSRVRDLAVINPLEDELTVTWTPGDVETEWLISYKESASATWGAEELVTSPPPYTITGLSASTSYDIKVRAFCGDSDTSNFSTVTGRTLCGDITSLPWTENFDSYSVNTFPPCMFKPLTYGNYPWTVTSTSASAPASLYFQSNMQTLAVTPRFSAEVTTMMVTFKLRREGSSSGTFQVGVMTDPLDATTFVPAATFNQTTYSTWEEFEVELNIPVTGAHYIGFKQIATASNWYYWLDDIRVETLGTCPRVSNVAIVDPLENELTVTWNTGSSETEWLVSYKESASATWGAEELVTSPPPYTITGLNASTSYDVRVRAYCGDGDTSNFRIVTGRTSCGDITSLPWTENFDSYSVNTFPPCMFKPLTYGNYPWTVTSTSASAPASLYFQSNMQTLAVTPRFSAEVTTMMVTFKLRREGSSSGTFQVGVMTDPLDATTFVPAATFNQTTYSTWEEFEVELNIPVTGAHYIGFKHIAATSYYYYWLDDIRVETLGTCPRVSNVAIVDPLENEITVTWNTGSTETEWLVSYKESASATWSAEELVTSPPPYIITGLNASTSYDVRVRAYCGDSDTSNFRTVTGRTSCGDITSLPWTENFDSYPVNTFPDCMFRPLVYGNYPWTVTSNSVSAPASLFFQSNMQTLAVTPRFADDVTNLMVTFKLRRESSSSGTFQVGIMTDPLDETTFVPAATFDQTTYNTWEEFEVMLGIPNMSDVHYIGFKQIATSSAWYYWLDDIEVNTQPVCDGPTNLQFTNLMSNIAEVTWEGGPDDIGWRYQLTNITTGEEFPEGTLTLEDGPGYTFSGISQGEEYKICVKSECRVNLSSVEVCTTFRTPVSAYTVTVTHEPANGGNINPPGILSLTPGSIQVFVITPNTNFTIEQVLLDGDEVSLTNDDITRGMYRISEIEQNHTLHVKFRDHTGVDENNLSKDMKLYPNPAHNSINIETQSLYKKAEVVNAIGEVIYSGNVENVKFDLDISGYASGLYLIRLYGDQGTATKKFVKE